MRLQTRQDRRWTPASQRSTPAPRLDERDATGRAGEELAAAWLTQRGYTLLHRNWSPSFNPTLGELDIVALAPDREHLAFVEVRTRRLSRIVRPEWTVTQAKQRQVLRVARLYLASAGRAFAERPVSMDVIGVLLPEGTITHLPGAFRDEDP